MKPIKLKNIRLHQTTRIDGFGNIGPFVDKSIKSGTYTLTYYPELNAVVFDGVGAAGTRGTALIPFMNIVSADFDAKELDGIAENSSADKPE